MADKTIEKSVNYQIMIGELLMFVIALSRWINKLLQHAISLSRQLLSTQKYAQIC